MEKALADVRGMLVEDNRFSVSVHYRMVAEEDRWQVEEEVDRIMESMPMLRRTNGKPRHHHPTHPPHPPPSTE